MAMPIFKSLSSIPGSALFKRKEPSVLGVDLGSSSIKVVQLRKEKEKGILETYGELATARYGSAYVGSGVKLVDIKVVEMLNDLMKEANITSKTAVVSVPLRSSFVSVVQFPLMSDSELAESVPYEARKYIPLPVSEVMLDWSILPRITPGEKAEADVSDKKKIDVMLVAIHRSVIDKYKNIFSSAGIEVSAVEIEIFSQTRSTASRELGPVLLIDLGAQSTRAVVVDYGVIRMTHNIERGAQDITYALSRSLGIDFERAEKLKRDTGLSQRPEHKEIVGVIEPLIDHSISEALRISSEYRRRFGHSIKRVVLTGGGALLGGVVDLAVNKFGVETRLASPFSKVVYPAFLEPALKEIGPSFSSALGLGLRELLE